MTVTSRTTGTWKAVHPATAITLVSSRADAVRVRPRPSPRDREAPEAAPFPRPKANRVWGEGPTRRARYLRSRETATDAARIDYPAPRAVNARQLDTTQASLRKPPLSLRNVDQGEAEHPRKE